MLPAANRLKKKKDLEEVFKKGRTFRDDLLAIRFVRNKLKTSRFAFSVGLKVSKKAFLRNRIRRRLREIIRDVLPGVKTGFDAVFMARRGLEAQKSRELKEMVSGLLKKTKLLS